MPNVKGKKEANILGTSTNTEYSDLLNQLNRVKTFGKKDREKEREKA